jgi:hypothetical protein
VMAGAPCSKSRRSNRHVSSVWPSSTPRCRVVSACRVHSRESGAIRVPLLSTPCCPFPNQARPGCLPVRLTPAHPVVRAGTPIRAAPLSSAPSDLVYRQGRRSTVPLRPQVPARYVWSSGLRHR